MINHKRHSSTMIWDEASDHWIDLIRNNKIQSRVESTNDALLRTILSYDANLILDVGCGEGWLCAYAEDREIAYIGIDGSIELIASAKRTFPKHTFLHRTYDQFSELNFDDEIDVAVFNFSIFMKYGFQQLLSDIRKVLNESGVIIIQTIHPNNIAISSENQRWLREDWGGNLDDSCAFDWYFRSMEEWDQDISSAGFKIIDRQDIYVDQYNHPFSLILTLG